MHTEQHLYVHTKTLIQIHTHKHINNSSKQYLPKYIHTYLSLLQRHRVQLSVVVLDLDGPRLLLIVVLVRDVHDGRDHVRLRLLDWLG
jgi:hypothetical protein